MGKVALVLAAGGIAYWYFNIRLPTGYAIEAVGPANRPWCPTHNGKVDYKDQCCISKVKARQALMTDSTCEYVLRQDLR